MNIGFNVRDKHVLKYNTEHFRNVRKCQVSIFIHLDRLRICKTC